MSADGTILAPHVVFSRPTEGVISFIATCAAVEFSAHRGKSMTAVRPAGTLSRSKPHTQRYTRVDIQRDRQTDRHTGGDSALPSYLPVALSSTRYCSCESFRPNQWRRFLLNSGEEFPAGSRGRAPGQWVRGA